MEYSNRTATYVNSRFVTHLFNGNAKFNSDTFKMILLNPTFRYDIDIHLTYADVQAYELPDDGLVYTPGGKTLTGYHTFNYSDSGSGDYIYFKWDDVVWHSNGGVAGPIGFLVIYDDTLIDKAIFLFIEQFVTVDYDYYEHVNYTIQGSNSLVVTCLQMFFYY